MSLTDALSYIQSELNKENIELRYGKYTISFFMPKTLPSATQVGIRTSADSASTFFYVNLKSKSDVNNPELILKQILRKYKSSKKKTIYLQETQEEIDFLDNLEDYLKIDKIQTKVKELILV